MRGRAIIFITILVTFITAPAFSAESTSLQSVFGIRAIDGDTIVVEFSDGSREHVRYASINAPRIDQCLGNQARDANQQLIQGKPLWIELNTTKDKYQKSQGELLAHVFTSAEQSQTSSIQSTLVGEGYALVDVVAPNDAAIANGEDFAVRYADWLISSQVEAAINRRGWWEDCDPFSETLLVPAVIKQWSNDETVYLVNRSSASIDLAAGWLLTDSSDSERNVLNFGKELAGGCQLEPSRVMQIHSGSIATDKRGRHTACGESPIHYYWTGHKIWNQDGDELLLFDPNKEKAYHMPYPLDWD